MLGTIFFLNEYLNDKLLRLIIITRTMFIWPNKVGYFFLDAVLNDINQLYIKYNHAPFS